ncbi:patatin-like phospholipase [Chitinophaga niastensis]|uniref:Patatin-like phospholipase n=1 Tax=Chitinophaga niastensis TaxID=536980 RepID=A0A2P8HVC8_CHINA|nr:patatin-like phospholipase family protein [Chitinophaga niastensis]PSL50170.1 patatin-like phospholipase [Chitinophaga niastensis]
MAKTALVISGGGSRGAFAVGVLKYLYAHRRDIQFDLFCGTSTSAIIAPLAALGEINLLEKLFTSNSTADIVTTANMVQRFTNNNALYNATPLVHKLNSIFTDARFVALEQLKTAVFVTGLCLQTGRTTYFSPTRDTITKKDYDIVKLSDTQSLREAVLASCSMPVFMPPVEMSSLPDQVQQFTNGGGSHYAPIQLAIDHGATNIYTILLTQETPPEDDIQFKNVIDILERHIDNNTNELAATDVKMTLLHNKALTYLDAVKNKMKKAGIAAADIKKYFDIPDADPFKEKKLVELHVIRPDRALDVEMGGMEFTPEVMKEMLAAGEEKAAMLFG